MLGFINICLLFDVFSKYILANLDKPNQQRMKENRGQHIDSVPFLVSLRGKWTAV